jgi:hypothetical protein
VFGRVRRQIKTLSGRRRFRLPWPLGKGRRAQWRAVLRKHPEAALSLVPWLLSHRPNRSPLNDEVPWIPFPALRWLERQVHAETRVFEWGSGGSTLFFARRARNVVSVEHHAEWHALVRTRLDQNGLHGCSYRLVLPRALAAGESCSFGSGQRGAEGLDFEAYVKVIAEYPDAHFDLIMIDGRARISCLKASWTKVAVGGHILLDNSNYPRYQSDLAGPANFERQHIQGVSPYRGDVWTQSTIWRRLS